MNIHEQLRSDCHLLGELDGAALLLHRNSAVGWLILVVDTEASDWHELSDAEHGRVSPQVRDLCTFAARWFAADKMNVASLGNQVPQLHVHIIARHTTDACWPKPVWGHLTETHDYPPSDIEKLQEALADELGLVDGS